MSESEDIKPYVFPHVQELWVIEAPGKVKTLKGILTNMGRDARVQATKGHVFSMPPKLTPLGIDKNLHEFGREPNMEVVHWLRKMAVLADRIFVATDADQEGDVIAWDVVTLVQDLNPNLSRVRLKGMDEASIIEAVKIAGPVLKEDAIPGRTRALVDRIIGATFSGGGVAVGRVGTAILGLVAQVKPTTGVLNLSAPSLEGGRPWIASTPITEPLDRVTAERLARVHFPALSPESSRIVTPKPAHTGRIMVRAADVLDMSPKETSEALQRVYESGKMSYPRAGSDALGDAAVMKMRDILKKSGLKFEPEVVARKSETDVHDAPHPLGNVDVSQDPRKLGHDEAIRTLVARDLVKAGQRHTVEKPVLSGMDVFLIRAGFEPKVARFIAGLDWRRERGPQHPGQQGWLEQGIVERRQDAVVLEAILEAGLGRPSTWANHVEGFLSRGLVDDQLKLTQKGQEWIDRSPPDMLDPRLSVAIEKACEKINIIKGANPSEEPWEELAGKILAVLPTDLKGPVTALVNSNPAQPRQNFIPAPEVSGLDFEALKEQAQTPSYGFKPPDGMMDD